MEVGQRHAASLTRDGLTAVCEAVACRRGMSLSALTVAAVFCTNALYAQTGSAYHDDTYEILDTGIEIRTISGSYGYERFRLNEAADGEPLAVDVRAADFIVANSRNSNPTTAFDCDQGSLPVNTYPLSVYYADFTALVGGLIIGEIPQESDWDPTYCNSAAVLFNYTAISGVVDGIRITSAWDALRMGTEAPGLYVKNSWISNVRDDILEDDDFHSTVFEDNLVDGTFQGISVHSGGDITQTPATTVRVTGNVIRIREYLYKGEQRYGALFKAEDSSPGSILHDNAIAVDYRGGGTFNGYWQQSWSKIEECSNNLFLWLSDAPIPSSVAPPQSCFTVVTGQEARDRWAQARQNWINCHPRVRRIASDPIPVPAECVANTFGGYTGTQPPVPLPPQLQSVD